MSGYRSLEICLQAFPGNSATEHIHHRIFIHVYHDHTARYRMGACVCGKLLKGFVEYCLGVRNRGVYIGDTVIDKMHRVLVFGECQWQLCASQAYNIR